jgi:GTP-binding protein
MLRLVFLLIDIRHEPSENDHMMYDWILHQGFEPIIIATKADKIKKTQLQKQINLIRNSMGISQETALIPYSAVTKQGREEIYAVIEQNMQSEMTSVD